jgi:UDP-glucose 4-epimerase
MQQTILITGGAGYIGSHISWLFAKQGYQVIVLDALLYQHYPAMPWATIIKGDVGDKVILQHIFSTYQIAAVIHCAAFIDVGASIKDPRLYYDNNVVRTLQLLQSMLEHRVQRIIVSSSAAVYGNPINSPIDELHPKDPLTPFAATKYMVERIVADFAQAYDITAVSLRYFNSAGAQPEDNLGELHEPETHLIPHLLAAVMEQKPCTVFGNDYDTFDGTCVRDFVHVHDIAHAHLLAFKHLMHNNPSDVFNIGTGNGVSVKQVIAAVEQLFNTQLKVIWAPRRNGDPAQVVADVRKAQQILGWQPRNSALEQILKSAYAFMCKQRNMQRLS